MIAMTLNAFFAMNIAPMQATITTRTPVKLNGTGRTTKTKNPFNTVYKIQKQLVAVNHDYETEVNTQRAVEGKATDFTAGRGFGTLVAGRSIIEKDGQRYLQAIKLADVGKATYEDAVGNPVTYDEIKDFVAAGRNAYKNQGLDDAVQFRTFNVENITNLIVKHGDLVLRLM